MESLKLDRFMDIPLTVEVLVDGLRMPIRDILSLQVGSIVESRTSAGGNISVLAGHSLLGLGELSVSGSGVAVRMLRFEGDS